MTTERRPQLAYSELMDKMLDEQARRRKASKLIAVITHFLGRADLSGLTALDIGCSGGFISDELAGAGARTDRDRHRRARAREGAGPVRRAGQLPEHRRRGAAVPRRLHRRDRLQPHLRARRRARAGGRRDAPGAHRRRRRLLRPDEPAGCRRAALPAAVPVLPPPAAGRPLPAGDPQGRPLLRAVDDGPRAAPPDQGCSGCGTTPCRSCWRRSGSTATTSYPPSSGGCRASLARAALPVVPTYVWIGTKSAAAPRGAVLRNGPVAR